MYQEINIDNNFEEENFIRNKDIKLVKRNSFSHTPWCPDCLPYDYRGPRLPQYISKARNYSIVACIIQILASISGLALFYIRRTVLYLGFNVVSFVMGMIGLCGVINLNKWVIALHGVFTMSILGSFLLYSLLEAIFNENAQQEWTDDKHYAETTILLLLSIPYLFDFISGCITFYLAYLMIRLDEQRDLQNNRGNELEMQLPENFNEFGEICIICADKKRNAIFYNCGHKISCIQCAKRLQYKLLSNCPMCRSKIIDIIQEYDA